MEYNFDELVDRKETGAKKWDDFSQYCEVEDVLPMWVADMDFKSSDKIIQALKKRVEHGVFGYGFKSEGFYDSVINWVKERYNWEIKKEWILFTPGVVNGLALANIALVGKGQKVIIQPPVYPPFYRVIENNGGIVSSNPLVYKDGKFVMNYDELESIIDPDSKLLMLCNPHNPVGRVWSKEELERVGSICLKNNIVIVSDEIHCDLSFKGNKYTPMASLSKELEQNTITLMSPSKTFNIAGVFTSVAIIPNEAIRNKVNKIIEKTEIDGVNIFGVLGFEEAYNNGGEWLEQAMEYIEANADYAVDFIRKNIPEIKLDKPEGTYLLWLNFKSLNKSNDEILSALINEGKVLLNDGRTFGNEGNGYFRLNIGCPRMVLEDGLNRIEKAVKSFR